MRLIPIGHVLRHVVSETLHVLKTRVLVIKSFAASGARVEMNTSSDVVNHFHLAKGKVKLTKTRNTGCLLISVACLGINNLMIFWSLRAEILNT